MDGFFFCILLQNSYIKTFIVFMAYIAMEFVKPTQSCRINNHLIE